MHAVMNKDWNIDPDCNDYCRNSAERALHCITPVHADVSDKEDAIKLGASNSRVPLLSQEDCFRNWQATAEAQANRSDEHQKVHNRIPLLSQKEQFDQWQRQSVCTGSRDASVTQQRDAAVQQEHMTECYKELHEFS